MNFEPELSRLVMVERLNAQKPHVEAIEASPEECEALAKRFELQDLKNFKATAYAQRVSGGKLVRVWGDLQADVVQTCVVSLAPVPSHVQAQYETFFTEEKLAADIDAEFSHDNDEDLPEEIENGAIDLGEVVAQYLSLELDPYPRAPDAELEDVLPAKQNPFSVLLGLVSKKDRG